MASETTAEGTSVFNTQNPQATLLSVNMSSVTKLTHQNYLMWGRQVRALLEGHELQQFIDGSDDATPPAMISENGVASPNPEYAPWRRQDRLLYSALIGAISLPLQTFVSTANTTKKVWDTLAETFGNPTRGHIRLLKNQINKCSKGTKTISEYMRDIKSKADDLALLGKPMDPDDLTEKILGGLGEEYKPEIDAVNGRDKPISFNELYERLLNREAMILCTESPAVTPIVAHAADSRPRHNNNSRSNHHQQNWSPHQASYNNNSQHNNRFSKPYLGRCQACGAQGHSAKYCPDYRIVKGSGSAQQWQQQTPHSGPQSWQQQSPHQYWQPRANAAMMSDSSTWLLDS